jgi:drug/metabolite transporter (DMT)-like permease
MAGLSLKYITLALIAAAGLSSTAIFRRYLHLQGVSKETAFAVPLIIAGVIGIIYYLLHTKVIRTELDSTSIRVKLVLVALAVISMAIVSMLSTQLSSMAPAAINSAFFATAPVFALIFSYFLLNEQVDKKVIIGIVGVVASMIYVARSRQ